MTKSRNILAPRKPWTAEQLAALKARYADERTEDLAKDIGREVRSIYNKAVELGLKKSAEYLAGPHSCRLRRGDGVGSAFRFQPGQAAWNKGLAGFVAGGRAAETQFKPGQNPHNTKPIGSFRITKDGTLQRKISNNKGSNSKRWRGVHELVWVEANGPVPAGHIVVFKPGMRTAEVEQITLDKVECISFAENMRRNTVHNLPKELAELVQLRGAIIRQINRRTGK